MDMDRQADEAWILSVQRKLYQWSKANPDDAWRDMWGWLTDLRMLRHAWRRVASNRGRRSAGVDGMTVGRIQKRMGEQRLLEGIQAELRSGAISRALRGANSSPRLEHRANSGRSVFPLSKIASFKARSKLSWSLSSKHNFGKYPMGSGQGNRAKKLVTKG
jgi:hypothetical protein